MVKWRVSKCVTVYLYFTTLIREFQCFQSWGTCYCSWASEWLNAWKWFCRSTEADFQSLAKRSRKGCKRTDNAVDNLSQEAHKENCIGTIHCLNVGAHSEVRLAVPWEEVDAVDIVQTATSKIIANVVSVNAIVKVSFWWNLSCSAVCMTLELNFCKCVALSSITYYRKCPKLVKDSWISEARCRRQRGT